MDLEEERMTSLRDNRGMLTVMSPWAWLPLALLGQRQADTPIIMDLMIEITLQYQNDKRVMS